MPRKHQQRTTPQAHRDPRFAAYDASNLRTMASKRSYDAGRRLLREGRMEHGKLRGTQLSGTFPVSTWWGRNDIRTTASLPLPRQPFNDTITFGCTCGDERPCQHIVALLLSWVERNETITEVPTFATQLAGRTYDDLLAIITMMVNIHPNLEAIIALPPPAPGRPGNVLSLNPGAVRTRVIEALDVLISRSDAWYDADDSELDRIILLSRQYADAGLWADAGMILSELAEQVVVVCQCQDYLLDSLDALFAQCDLGLSTALAVQNTLPEADRLTPELRSGIIQALFHLWRAEAPVIGALSDLRYGPSTIALQGTVAEQIMVDQWLHNEPVTSANQQLEITAFRSILFDREDIDDEQVVALAREAEHWDRVSEALLRLNRVGEAIAIAKRRFTICADMTTFAAALADAGHLDRAITVVEDFAWEIDGRDVEDDQEVTAWLAYHYTRAGRASEAISRADIWFAQRPGINSWRGVRDAAALPGQPADAWSSRHDAMMATLIASDRWGDVAVALAEESRIDEAIDAYNRFQETLRANPFMISPDERHAIDIALAEARERANPDGMIALYREHADAMIGERKRESYQQAVRLLARVQHVLQQQDRQQDWVTMAQEIRAHYRNLPAFQEEFSALDP